MTATAASASARLRHIALVAAVGVLAAVLPAAGAPAGAPGDAPQGLNPPPPGAVEVVPGDVDLQYFWMTDDSLWALSTEGTVIRRSLDATDSAVTLGRAEEVVRVEQTAVAAADGTIGYLRPVDHRIVFRAPDGAEEVPAWGTGDAYRWGVGALTADWFVTGDWGNSVVSRATGAQLDLMAVSSAPADSTAASLGGVALAEDRVVWAAVGARPGGGWSRVYTAALGPDGIVGPVLVLDSAAQGDWMVGGSTVAPLTMSGPLILWSERTVEPSGPGRTTLRWLPGPPYTATPGSLELGSTWLQVVGLTGTSVVLRGPRGGGLGEQLEWHDLASADPSAVTRTVVVPWAGQVHVHGSLVGYSDSISSSGDPYETWLFDVDGRPITADQRPLVRLPSFTDVARYGTFAEEILWLADRGVVAGYPDGSFRGLAAINRDAVAAFLYRAVHGPGAAPACATAPFTDVPVSHPFCGEVAWLVAEGVATGWPDGSFRPGVPVTREAVAAFVYRLVHDDVEVPACTEAPFSDVGVVNPFCGAVAWLAETGVSTGWADGTYRPALSIERQAMAAFLARLLLGGGLLPAGEA